MHIPGLAHSLLATDPFSHNGVKLDRNPKYIHLKKRLALTCLIERETGYQISGIRSDAGGEQSNIWHAQWRRCLGMLTAINAPYSLVQNTRVEVTIGVIMSDRLIGLRYTYIRKCDGIRRRKYCLERSFP